MSMTRGPAGCAAGGWWAATVMDSAPMVNRTANARSLFMKPIVDHRVRCAYNSRSSGGHMEGIHAETVMKAFIGMFFTFRDGKIVSQRNYDCYPPFET